MIDLKEKSFSMDSNRGHSEWQSGTLVVTLTDALAAVEDVAGTANNYVITLHEVAQQLGVNWCGDADNDAVMEAARNRHALPVGENAQLIAEAMKGVRCLYIAVEEVIARDIEARVRRLADALEVSVRERDVLAAGFKAAIRVMELEAVAWDTEPLGSSHETGLDNRTRTARMNDESRRLAIRAALELVKGEQV